MPWWWEIEPPAAMIASRMFFSISAKLLVAVLDALVDQPVGEVDADPGVVHLRHPR